LYKFLIILLFLASLKAAEEYQLGEGAQIGSLPLYMGGYVSLDYKSAENEDRYRIDDIAVLGYGGYDKFSYMAEVEFKKFYVRTYSSEYDNTSHNTRLYLERVYLDYNLNENYSFRAGKYNSPIGFWNLLPINVLRETSSSPVSSSILFPKFTTGLGLSYTTFGTGELKIDIMAQNNHDLDAKYNNYEVDRHYGVGLTYEVEDYTYKLNGGYFHKDNIVNEPIYYMLLSAKYEADKYQILSEFGTQTSKDDTATDYAGYVQAVYRATEQHIGILRLETYDDNVANIQESLAIVGYTYRPLYPIAIKSEYQFHEESDLDQILFSLSVLF